MERQSEFSAGQEVPGGLIRHKWALRMLEWRTEALILCFLAGFAFFVNRHMEISGLYMDDLYQWNCYNTNGFITAVFFSSETRLRWLYNLASYIEMKAFGIHVNWYVPFNILLNTGLAYTLFRMARRLSHSLCVGFLASVLFLASRMSYYQIGQALGLMETMALWMAIGILWLLSEYLSGAADGQKQFFAAVGLYVAVCFVHERYMALLPLFFLVLLFRKCRAPKCWAAPAAGFAAVQLARLAVIGTVSPAGTGGTDVADTVTLPSVLRFSLSQIAYIFGINDGDSYLNGQNFMESPLWVLALIALADLLLAALTAAFVVCLVKNRRNRALRLQMTALFIFFTGACIVCSSVTIRVEMRWVYVSFAAALLFLSYMYGVLTEETILGGHWMLALPYLGIVAGYVLLMLPVEMYYRGQFPNLYYWYDQEHYNSLAEETFGNYGVGIFGKTIYIIGDSFEMEEFTEENFFRVFDSLNRDNSTRVVHIDDVRDMGLVTDEMLVIQEDPEHNRYQDVTHVVDVMKCRPITGFYDDGWIDERSEVQVMAGSTGQIHLSFWYPRDLTGDQWLTVYADDEPVAYLFFDITTKTCVVEAEPYTPVRLRFETNFYVPNALEKRGETCLALLLTMTAD